MEKTFQIYYTSDTHGHIFPVNYASNCPENSGLLNLAAQVEKGGNTLVLDGGDSLQGTPLTQYYLENRDQWPVHPVAAAFNAMGLDYFTLGNHDFNFGYGALRDYLNTMDGVCLCANVEDLGGELRIRPWVVHTLANGLRMGITGVVTDFVNVWEQPQNLERIRITDAFQAARATCAALREQCDVCVCIYHGGFEEELETGRALSDSGENLACKIARELDFDLLLTGHQHMVVEGVNLSGTYAVQPPRQCRAVSPYFRQVEGNTQFLSIQIDGGGRRPPSRALSESASTGECRTGLAGPAHRGVGSHHPAGGEIGSSPLRQPGGCPVQPGAVGGDRGGLLLHQPGERPSGAGLSGDYAGGVTAAYLFANTLVVLEVTEEVLRQTLERCATYFTLVDGQPQIAEEFLLPKVEHYNYDFYAGLSYTFDLRRPVGSRVIHLAKLDGSPLGGGTFRLCTSNYRATGTGGYEILRECPVLWRGGTEMPDLTARYIQTHSPMPQLHNVEMRVIW